MTAHPHIRIDLVSDTATRPDKAMRAAMAAAEVGDESRGEDPTVNRLCARVAGLLGKEAAIFLPSGTMCNQVALAVHCAPGDEIWAAADSHVLTSEGAGAAVLAGSLIREVSTSDGRFGAAALAGCLARGRSARGPNPRLVVVEQTHNRGGGTVWPLAQLQAVSAVARQHGLALHMDGARLMNAVVASGVAAQHYADCVDSAWIDFSKGLGAPMGGALAGTRAFISAARTWKLRLGGGLRQAGIMAAAALHALEYNIDRLAEDHANARQLAARLAQIPGVALNPAQVETNLVFFDIAATGMSARQLVDALAARGIRIGADGPHRLRAVTHLDIDASALFQAANAIEDVLRRSGDRQVEDSQSAGRD